MSAQIPASLKGLRVRLVTPASDKSATKEQAAYAKLKKLLAEHGQHLSKEVLSQFRRTLNGLLLHGLRARKVESSEGSEIRFKASDGKLYVASAKAWLEVQKRDPGARKVDAASAESEKPKGSLADRLFANTIKSLG
jgi:hypothetical protein